MLPVSSTKVYATTTNTSKLFSFPWFSLRKPPGQSSCSEIVWLPKWKKDKDPSTGKGKPGFIVSLSTANVCSFANQSNYIWGGTQTAEGSVLALSYGIDLVDYKRKGEKDSNPSSKLYSF